MARNKKSVDFETAYVEKMEFLNELYQERTAFLATFSLPQFGLEAKVSELMEQMAAGEGAAEGTGGDGDIVGGNSDEEKAWNFFAGKGFTNAAAAGILGNLQQESGINPKQKQYGGGPGRGLCQWEKGHAGNGGRGRWENLVEWAKGQGKDEWDINTQLGWLWEELNGKDPYTKTLLDRNWGGIEGLKNAKDYKWAVDAFEKSFERAGKPMFETRYKYAKGFLDKYGKGKQTDRAVATAPPTSGGGGSKATGDAKKVIDIAESWLKKENRYVFGGGRSAADIKAGRFDCSSWCRFVYSEAGIDIMNNGGELWGNTDTIMGNKKFKTISSSELRAGDLIFLDTVKKYGHVGVCLGNGLFIGTQTSTGIAIVDYTKDSYWKPKLSNQHKRVFS